MMVLVARDYHDAFSTQDRAQLMRAVKAVIYARVSTQDQAKHGYSLESQVQRCVEFAKTKYGVAEQEVIAVVEQGEMGDDPTRLGLNFALELVEDGIGTKFIVLHPDRLARDLKLQLFITERIWNAGCEIAFVEVDVDPNNPESLLLYNIQGAIAQYNKAKILANSKRGRKTKAMNGKIPGIRRIYGYSFDKVEDILTVNEMERDVYLMMVNWVLYGKNGLPMNLTSIARELSILGIPAPSGDKWYQATVSRILKNPVYTGTYYYGKTESRQKSGKKQTVKKPKEEWQVIQVPAYIDKPTFDRLQEKVLDLGARNRGAKPRVPYLLKSLVRCGRCSAAVVAGSASREKETGMPVYHYYVCSGKSRKIFEVGTGRQVHACKGRNWRQDVVDDVVWNYVVHWLGQSRETIEEIWEEGVEDEVRGELALRRDRILSTLARKRSERLRWLQMAAKGRVDEGELDVLLHPLEDSIAELEAELGLVESEVSVHQSAKVKRKESFGVSRALQSYLRNGITDREKRMLVQLLVNQVVLHDHEIDIHTTWRPSRSILT